MNLKGAIEKFRAFADIGRAQGITVTASVAICGALTSTHGVEWYHLVYFTLIACFLHTTLNTYIARHDVDLDIHTYTSVRNPIITGELSPMEALHYVWYGSIIGFLLILPFFLSPHYEHHFILPTLLCASLSFFWLIWYGYNGKHVLGSYDYSFSVSYSFWVLFGVFAVGGMPTIYTWLFIGVVVFAATAFAQWENGFKDVTADRVAGVRSFAVVSGVEEEKLGIKHPYILYGIGLKSGFFIICILAFLIHKNIYYLIFLLLYGISTQAFIMYRFITKEKAITHRKTILYDVTLSGILVYSVIFGKVGLLPIVLLVFYLIGGYLIGSALQSRCEFKFGRFSNRG